MDARAYRDHVLAHYRNPQRASRLDAPSATYHLDNPLCGDKTDVDVLVANGVLSNVGHVTDGCAICVAAASLIAEAAVATNIAEILAWDQDEAIRLLGVKVPPVRIKCAALVLVAVQNALRATLGDAPVGLSESVRGSMDVTKSAMATLRNQI